MNGASYINEMPGARSGSMILIGLLVVAIGAWLIYACREDLLWAWQSRQWPSTVGHICGTVTHEGVSQGLTTDGTCAPTENKFRVTDWVFSYTVASKDYQSSRFSFSAMGWQENDQYLEDGTEVKVYYCPSDPSIAVLRPGVNPALLSGPGILVFGLVLMAYALFKS